MLKKMILLNFLSFSELTEFSFSPTKYGILSETNVSSTNILKGGLLVGPNASGKTNALKGIGFLLNLFKDEKTNFVKYHCLWGQYPYYEVKYVFDFSGDTVEYMVRYYIHDRNLEEKLMVNDTEILTRMGSTGKLALGSQSIINNNLNRETIFLRTAAFATGDFPDQPVLRKLIKYISNSTYITSDAASRFAVKDIESYAENNGLDKVNQYLKWLGYDFSVEYTNKSMGENISIESPDKKVVIFKRDSFQVPIVFAMESQGNLTFTCLLPHIIDTIEAEGMIVIDEFGNSLHNYLAEKIIRFFMKNADQSQIFITSHCTNLISNSVFRPDQINIVSFEGKNGSKVKRVSDYKPREAQNLEKMYLGGMFEGLPYYE